MGKKHEHIRKSVDEILEYGDDLIIGALSYSVMACQHLSKKAAMLKDCEARGKMILDKFHDIQGEPTYTTGGRP
ncbi:MAG: hypothetical protein WCJ37_03545 [Syntrophus sp. (in: bacteria)]